LIATSRSACGLWFGLVLGAGVACAAPPGEASDRTFDAGEWVLVEISGEPLEAGGPEATLAWDAAERRIAGSAGCNRYFAGVVQGPEGGVLELGPVATTRMMCPPPEMDLEQRFLARLEATERWEHAGDRLVLSGPSGGLAFEARSPR
jgi:heat shock protein HslJ